MADAGYLELEQGSEPSTPSMDLHKIYVDQVDEVVKHKLPDGSVVSLEGNNGTVTSVDVSVPVAEFTSSNGPITSSGTIAITKNNQNSNTVWAGPSSGSPNPPTFRSLVDDDIPNIDFSKITTGTVPIARGGTNSSTALNNNRVMQSFAGAIVEANAITVNRAVISDANGIPTHSPTTSTEIGYSSGVTSSIQTQINAKADSTTVTAGLALKADKAGDTFTGPVIAKGNNTGTGYINYEAQTAAPSTPTSGFRLFANALGKLTWKGTNGFLRTFDGTANTADRTYVLPDQDATLMVNPMTTVGDSIYGATSGNPTRLPIGTTGQGFRVTSGLPAWGTREAAPFGDANLGDVTLTGLFNALGVGHFNTLAINGAGQYITNGYPIFCKTLDLRGASANAISWNGANGNSSTAAAGGTAGGAQANTYYGGGGNGTAGGAGSTNAGVQAGAPTAQNPSNGGSGGTGRAGGTATSAGGALRAGAGASNPVRYATPVFNFIRGISLINGGAGGAGGGGGGGTGAVSGFGGGAGGSGGGIVAIFCETLITDGTTAASAISANGGNAGNSATATNLNTASGGGGGGGGGGYVYLVYATKSGAAVSALIRANGGTGGNSGNGNGTGGAGNAGDGGDSGYIDVININTLTGIHVSTSPGATGGNAVGSTGATGGAGGTSTVSL